MGNSKYESSIDKLNFQILKAKFGENGLKKNLGKREENEKHRGNKGKEKEKKRFWWKWLRSVRGHWSSQGTNKSHKKTDVIVKNSLNAGDNVTVSPNPTVVDIVEIPVTAGEKSSTKTGIKTMITQYHGSSVYSDRLTGDELSVSDDFSHENTSLERNEEKVNESGRTGRKRLTWNTEIFESNTDMAENHESLLTSALFIKQDMDKVVESTVFIEPQWPKDYVDSNKTDEISQKSVRNNKTEISYEILDDKNDRISRTFKSVSEPTWDERKEIFRHQRLQDNINNINNLLEQFMLLEVEDVINLPVHQNKLRESKKKIELSLNSGLNSKKPLIKELSREVSPEILVNIKPFKEYVPVEYIDNKESSPNSDLKNNILGSKEYMVKKTTEELEMKTSKASKESIFPLLKCSIKPAMKSDFGDVTRSSYEVTEGTLSLSHGHSNTKNAGEQILNFVSTCKDSKSVMPCTVSGMYRSYPPFTNLLDEEESEIEKRKSKISLDEVLDNLDDSDHGAIFQKNISQFRKKINIMPRLEGKPSVNCTGKMEVAKRMSMSLQKSGKREKLMGFYRNGFEKTKTISLKCSNKKKVGAFRFDCLDLWSDRQRQQKVFENLFLQLPDAKMIFRPRVEATRVEARTISFPRTLREVHDILESNNFTVIEVEMPIGFEKNIKNMELFWVGNKKALQWADKPLIDVKNYVTVAVVLSFQGQDFDGKFCTTENDVGELGKHILQSSKFFPQTSERFYLVHNQLLLDYAQKSRPNLNALQVNEMFDSAFGEKSNKTEHDTELIPFKREEHILKLYEQLYRTHFGLVEILNESFCEYLALIYDSKFFPADGSSERAPECYAFEDNLNDNYSADILSENSTSTQNQLKNKTTDSVNDEKSKSNFTFDGFQILYNNSKESLDDEDETMKMVFAKHLLEKNPRSAILSKTEIFKRGKDLQNEIGDYYYYDEEVGRQKKKNGYCNEETNVLRSLEKKFSRTLKYKSKSSTIETIHETEFCCHEHRMRRSLLSPKEIEKDFHDCRRRRLSFDRDIEINKTGSAFLESRISALVEEGSCVQKKTSFDLKETLQRLVLSFELQASTETHPKSVEKKKKLGFEKKEINVRKEVVAAFNSIKELNKCKGENKGHKRLSVVIMLSRK